MAFSKAIIVYSLIIPLAYSGMIPTGDFLQSVLSVREEEIEFPKPAIDFRNHNVTTIVPSNGTDGNETTTKETHTWWWWQDQLESRGNWWDFVHKPVIPSNSAIKVKLITTGMRDPVIGKQLPTGVLKESFTIPQIGKNCTVIAPELRAPLIGMEIYPRGEVKCVELYNKEDCTGPYYRGGNFTNHYPDFMTVYNEDKKEWMVMPFFHVSSLKTCTLLTERP